MPVYDRSFLPIEGRQPQEKLEKYYAQIYAKYTKIIELQGDEIRQNTERAHRAYYMTRWLQNFCHRSELCKKKNPGGLIHFGRFE